MELVSYFNSRDTGTRMGRAWEWGQYLCILDTFMLLFLFFLQLIDKHKGGMGGWVSYIWSITFWFIRVTWLVSLFFSSDLLLKDRNLMTELYHSTQHMQTSQINTLSLPIPLL